MLSFTKKLPDAVQVDGSFIYLDTDFRLWIQFGIDIRDEEKTFADLAYIFKDPYDVLHIEDAVIDEIMKFYSASPEYPISTGDGGNEEVVDLEADAPYIYAEFMRSYNIDLMTADLHWWQFRSLLYGIWNSYKDIVGYRAYRGDDKDMQKLKAQWKLKVTQPQGDPDITSVLLHGGDFGGGE